MATQPTPSASISSGRRRALTPTMFIDGELAQFAPINGRYRLLHFIGRGGMGEVYEAIDLELQEHVALKFLRSELIGDDHALTRFRREIRLARKVVHPNVCQVYDVGRCAIESANAPGEEVSFLSMELLQGETLASRLRNHGPMSTQEALPLVTQIASALAAAHDAGVVHHDLKSSNIMLIQSPRGDKAVVTDFGLAQAFGGDGGDVSALGRGGVTGTPAYMAPEQVEGKAITPAADIFSFGVVLFEMVTGQRPYVGETAFDTAFKRLRMPPPSPREFVPDLDACWETVILRCLARDPEKRYVHAEDIPAALRGEKTQHLRRRRLRRAVTKPVLVTLAAGVALFGIYFLLKPAEPGSSSGAYVTVKKALPAVAVLGFSNLSQQPQTGWLTIALADMLSTELSIGKKLRCISSDDIARTQVELVVEDKTSLAPQTLEMVRGRTGADFVVVGSFLAMGSGGDNRIRLDISIQDAFSGRVLGEYSGNGSEEKIIELVVEAGAHLREHLGVSAREAQPGENLRPLYGLNIEAIKLYAEGIGRLRAFDPAKAEELLQRAVTLHPGYALAHLALARAWADLGDGKMARLHGMRAIQCAAILPSESKLFVEGRALRLCREPGKANQAFHSLVTAFPTNPQYAAEYLDTLIDSGRATECLAEIPKIRAKLDPADRENPRFDLLQAQVYRDLARFDRQMDFAKRAEAKARLLGMKLVRARSLEYQGIAWHGMGNFTEARLAFERAQMFYTEIGDKKSVSRVAVSLLEILRM